MLLTKDLIEGVEEKYVPMLTAVNIPNFTKCYSIFSGISMQDISDKAIKEVLLMWAEHKYKFFSLFGNKLQVDMPIKYSSLAEDVRTKWETLRKPYPAYIHWFKMFRNCRTNKIDERDFYYSDRDILSEVLGTNTITGLSLTHFFKSKLFAPDDLVTAIAAIYENATIEATFTMSIDPVDIMTASENPYNWTSCYRLEHCTESHADGCAAALVDTSSIITYVWKDKGKLNLYREHDLKDVRFKMMRMWVAFSENLTTIHFNAIYPQKDQYPQEFRQLLRTQVEGYVANKLNLTDKWGQSNARGGRTVDCDRKHYYGYSEFDSYNMWTQTQSEPESITVYNHLYPCACGCGTLIGPYDEDDGLRYLGDGFSCTGFEEQWWCEYCDDYCSHECDGYECEGCSYWEENHPYCETLGVECPDVPEAHWEWGGGGRSIDPEEHKEHCSQCTQLCAYNKKMKLKAQHAQVVATAKLTNLKGRKFKLGTPTTGVFKISNEED